MNKCIKYEEWIDIKYYEGLYQVSDLGRVKSLNYKNSGKEKLLSLGIISKYYSRVALFKDKKPKSYLVNRLVASAFLGLNINNIKELACHKKETLINGLLDNSKSNLWVGTHKDNNRDRDEKKRHGTKYYPKDRTGTKQTMIKLYKNYKDYGEQNNPCRQTASKRIEEGLKDGSIIKLERGVKYIEVNNKES